MIGFSVLARSLREAFYLERFDVATLPYITATLAILSIPTSGIFARWLDQFGAKRVLIVFLSGLMFLSAVLAALSHHSSSLVVCFYVCTALGTIFLTSAFWMVASDRFALRSAKRLFGVISAGGTLGAMVAGNSVRALMANLSPFWLGMTLLGLLLATLVCLLQLFEAKPRPSGVQSTGMSWRTTLFDGLHHTRRHPQLLTLAMVVLCATFVSTLVDFQFKALAKSVLTSKAELGGFLGSFYGWTGLVSLLIQLTVSSPLLAKAGLSGTLCILPSLLFLGSMTFGFVPTLMIATVVRGADNSLRKSIHRSAVEVTYVPVEPSIRRRTKTFIDSVLDSVAEGLGSLAIFLVITVFHFSKSNLTWIAAIGAGAFFYFAIQLGRRYRETLVSALKNAGKSPEELMLESRFDGRDLLSATFAKLPDVGIQSSRSNVASAAIGQRDQLTGSMGQDVASLIKGLARDSARIEAKKSLESMGPLAEPLLIQSLVNPDTDFAIRRRIPSILTTLVGSRAEDALVAALSDSRFEVRFRAGAALVRRAQNLPIGSDTKERIWAAIGQEVEKGRPVWELAQLLDPRDEGEGEWASKHAESRISLSLEHIFRLLTLLLDPKAVQAAYFGIHSNNGTIKSLALEYLEQSLPASVRTGLWASIGDVSDYVKRKSVRPVGEVVEELLKTGATLFASEKEKDMLEKLREKPPS